MNYGSNTCKGSKSTSFIFILSAQFFSFFHIYVRGEGETAPKKVFGRYVIVKSIDC